MRITQLREKTVAIDADPKTLIDEEHDNLDPAKIWACMMTYSNPTEVPRRR
jgi:hypothetical protein